MHALARKNTKTIRQNGNLRYLCLPSFVLRRSLNGTCETLRNTSPAGQGALFFLYYLLFFVAAPQNRHLCLFQLFWYCAVCLFVISASSSSASFQFSFMHNQKMDGEETQGIQKKLTFIWHVIDVKSVNQMNFRIFPPLYSGFYHLSALCFGCNACSFIKDSPKS